MCVSRETKLLYNGVKYAYDVLVDKNFMGCFMTTT